MRDYIIDLCSIQLTVEDGQNVQDEAEKTLNEAVKNREICIDAIINDD